MKPSEALRALVEELTERHKHREQSYMSSNSKPYLLLQLWWEVDACLNIARRHLAAAEARERDIDPYGPMPGSEDEQNLKATIEGRDDTRLRAELAAKDEVLAKVRRRCAMVLKSDSYSLFQKQFAESILNESGEAAGG